MSTLFCKILLIKLYDQIVSSVRMLYFFDYSLSCMNTLRSLVNSRHCNCWFHYISKQVRIRTSLCYFHLLAFFHQPLSFHFKPFLSHDKSPPVSDIPAGFFPALFLSVQYNTRDLPLQYTARPSLPTLVFCVCEENASSVSTGFLSHGV